MIGKLKGQIEEIGEDYLILDVNGVGYLVYCSSKTIASSELNSKLALFIETHVREDQITLYGFLTNEEKSFFEKLVTVKGIGPKLALAIIANISIESMAKAIAFQDKSFLVGVSGLGPKLVARLLTELKEKDLPVYASGAISTSASSVANASLKNEAVSALCNLGVSKSESLSIVTKLLIENPDISINELIKQGLKNLNKNSQ